MNGIIKHHNQIKYFQLISFPHFKIIVLNLFRYINFKSTSIKYKNEYNFINKKQKYWKKKTD